MVKINGVELELDIFDMNVAEKYEKAIAKVQEEAAKSKGLKLSSSIRKQCTAVFECFDAIFGEGTHQKIFGERVNLIDCLKAFESLIQGANDQVKEVESINNKYSSNRAKRRSKN